VFLEVVFRLTVVNPPMASLRITSSGEQPVETSPEFTRFFDMIYTMKPLLTNGLIVDEDDLARRTCRHPKPRGSTHLRQPLLFATNALIPCLIPTTHDLPRSVIRPLRTYCLIRLRLYCLIRLRHFTGFTASYNTGPILPTCSASSSRIHHRIGHLPSNSRAT